MSNYTGKKLGINIVFSLIQILISAIVLFFLYRYTIELLGIKQFGIWSIVSTSITSLTILNYGFSGSLVKYIAKYQSRQETEKVKSLLETSILSITLFAIILTFGGYLFFSFLLPHIIKGSDDLSLAFTLVKICLLTFFVTIISNAFQAALEGLNYIFIKSIINIVISVVLLVSSFLLLQQYELMGLAYAYLIANLLGLVISVIALKMKFPAFVITGWKWNHEMFKETLRYNYNFQLISIFSLFNDPVTKFLLARFGGAEYAGLYELASKLVMQVRHLLSTANQALVPIFASLQETKTSVAGNYFRQSFLYIFLLSTFLFFAVLAFSPLLSLWWLSEINYLYILFLFLITISWYINAITMPAYFANLGSGRMKWNTISHVGMGLSNLVLSVVIGYLANPIFICVAWSLVLSFFSLLIIVKYNKENQVRLADIMPAENWGYLVLNILLSGAMAAAFFNRFDSYNAILIIAGTIYFLIQFYFLWNNTAGKELKMRVFKLLPR
jgi:O-antigen/teichoic acid export membrane protein